MNSNFSQFISWLFIGCNMQFQETGLETIFCAMWCRVETQILENCQKLINCCSERSHIELVDDKERFCLWCLWCPRKVLSKLSFSSTYPTADQDKHPPIYIWCWKHKYVSSVKKRVRRDKILIRCCS